MTDFKGIRGWKVQTLSTDPAASVADSGAWASGGSMNTARRALGGAGIQTASLCVGGTTGSAVGNTENYNGSSWSEVNDLSTARNQLAGNGTATAALAYGGATPSATTA